MNTRRLASIVVLVGGLAVAGCTGSSTPNSTSSAGPSGAAASSAAPASPRDALLNALAPMTKTSYKYTLSSGGLTGQGANDPANKKATLALTGTATNGQQGGSITVNALAIGTDLWLKLDFGSANSTLKISTDKWFHIDATKLGANPTLPVDPNGGANTAALLKNAVDVKQTDGTHYSGTVDLTGGSTSTPLGQPDIDRLGQKAKAVPFTATLDSQGRLTEVKLDFPAVDPQIPAVTSTYSDYGTTVTANRPDPAQVQEAPDSLYQIFKTK